VVWEDGGDGNILASYPIPGALCRFTGPGLKFRLSLRLNNAPSPDVLVLGDCQVGRWVQPSGRSDHLSASFLVHPMAWVSNRPAPGSRLIWR